MSQETSTWLNQNVLIGQTDKRGTAWHYKASEQGTEPNHYTGFIPVADVERRLFTFDQVKRDVGILVPVVSNVGHYVNQDDTVTLDGKRFRFIVADEFMAVADDANEVLGIHGADYQIHSYRQWLLDNVATILDDDLGITSAGLLRKRRQAWVEVSVPDNVETPEGVTFRPNLLAATSHDATIATTYKRTATNTVCDNTLRCSLNESGQEMRVRHTSGSLGRIAEARVALNIIYAAADDFSQMVRDACRVEVTDKQWQAVLDAMVPLPEDETNKRSMTMAGNKRDKLDDLYHLDARCYPWKGTKWGVVQTFNTWKTHYATVRNVNGGGRVERNMANVIGGQLADFDISVSQAVDDVLAAA